MCTGGAEAGGGLGALNLKGCCTKEREGASIISVYVNDTNTAKRGENGKLKTGTAMIIDNGSWLLQ